MEIEFNTEECLNYYTGNYSGKQKFSKDILKRYRDKINYKDTLPAHATHPGQLILDEIEFRNIFFKKTKFHREKG